MSSHGEVFFAAYLIDIWVPFLDQFRQSKLLGINMSQDQIIRLDFLLECKVYDKKILPYFFTF